MNKLRRTMIPSESELRAEIENAPWLKGTGKIVYDPYRPGMSSKTKWWAVVQLDKELTRYYRESIKQRFGIELHQPSWDAHISVIRGEKPKPHLVDLWKKHHGKVIEFDYQHFPRYNGDTRIVTSSRPGSFWFVDVKSEILTSIRDEMELPSDWNQHLTVGRTW